MATGAPPEWLAEASEARRLRAAELVRSRDARKTAPTRARQTAAAGFVLRIAADAAAEAFLARDDAAAGLAIARARARGASPADSLKPFRAAAAALREALQAESDLRDQHAAFAARQAADAAAAADNLARAEAAMRAAQEDAASASDTAARRRALAALPALAAARRAAARALLAARSRQRTDAVLPAPGEPPAPAAPRRQAAGFHDDPEPFCFFC